MIKTEICNNVEHKGIDSLTTREMNDIFDKFSIPFQNMNTEAKRFNHFKNCETFIQPESVKLGEGKVIVEKKGKKN